MKKSELEKVLVDTLKGRYTLAAEFKAVFTRPKDGCYPDAFIGSDLEGDIRRMFAWYYESILGVMFREKGLQDHANVHVVARWEDSSDIVITYRGQVLLEDYEKAWNFEFDGLRDLKESMVRAYRDLEAAVDRVLAPSLVTA